MGCTNFAHSKVDAQRQPKVAQIEPFAPRTHLAIRIREAANDCLRSLRAAPNPDRRP